MWEPHAIPWLRLGLFVSNLFDGLTPFQIQVCAAWVYDRLPQKLIAVRFGISQQAVSRTIRRAKRRLSAAGLDTSCFRAAA